MPAMKRIQHYVPNFLSFLRIIIAPALWYAIVYHQIASALLLLSVAALSDFGDGYFARRFKVVSATGTFLDPLADKVVVLAGFCAFWQLHLVAWWVVVVIAGRDVLVTVLRTLFLRAGTSMKTAWLAKIKTGLQFCALYLLILGSGIYHGVLLGSLIGITERLSARYLLWWIGVLTAAVSALSGLQYAVRVVWQRRRR